MRFSAKFLTRIALLVLPQLFSSNVQAQTWTFKVYGCLAGGGNTTTEVNRKEVFVKTGVANLDNGYTLNVQGNVASGFLAYSSGLQYVRNLGAR